MLDMIIANGTVVSAAGQFKADIGICGGKITSLVSPEKQNKIEAKTLIDATNLFVLPGAVDAHTHISLETALGTSADTYESGSRAAVCGGVTTIFDYPTQTRDCGIIDTVKKRLLMAEGKLFCDLAFHCAISNLGNDDSVIDTFAAAADFGITSFKVYMAYKETGLGVDDGVFLKILKAANSQGILVNVHAENCEVLVSRQKDFVKSGRKDVWHHYLSRPEFVEAEAVHRAIVLAEAANAPLYIVHVSAKESLQEIENARMRGLPIFAETCPHYLEFTNEVYKRPGGALFVCSPPMKSSDSKEALWTAVNKRLIDTAATDHCPFTKAQKLAGLSSEGGFTKIPNGLGGVEILYPYILSAALEGKISLERAVELASTNPARIFGCTQKGSLLPGNDADIVLFDPSADTVIHNENFHGHSDHSVYEGLTLKGKIQKVFLRGNLMYDSGKLKGQEGIGKFIKRVKGEAFSAKLL